MIFARFPYDVRLISVSIVPKNMPPFWEAVGWRLRLLVGRGLCLRAMAKTTLRVGRIRTVAGTGKDPHDFGGSTMATAPFGRGSLSRFVPVPRTHYALGVFGQSPLPEKDPHDLETARWRLRLLVGRVSSFVPVPRTHYALGVFGQSPLPEKIRTILETARWRLRLLSGRGNSSVPVP